MSIRQISVFLENKPGKLYELTQLLADHRIDMRALSIAETADFGIARLIVSDVDRAARLLREEQFIARLSSVLAFAVPDEPGGLRSGADRPGPPAPAPGGHGKPVTPNAHRGPACPPVPGFSARVSFFAVISPDCP